MRRPLLAALLAASCAHRAPSRPVITSANSPTPTADLRDKDLSREGKERGITEFALAGVTGALSASLLVLGGFELKRGYEIRDFCAIPMAIQAPECTTLTGDPFVAAKVSAGLSFFFAVPIGVASGFLLRRGLRVREDAREWRAANPELSSLRVAPWSTRQGGGLGLRFRF